MNRIITDKCGRPISATISMLNAVGEFLYFLSPRVSHGGLPICCCRSES